MIFWVLVVVWLSNIFSGYYPHPGEFDIWHRNQFAKEYIPPLFSEKSIYHPYSLKRVYTTTSILVPLMVLQLFRVLAAGWSGGA